MSESPNTGMELPDRLRVVGWPLLRAALVWLLAAAGVVWLYRTSAGGADAPALAESRDHKVSVVEAGTVGALAVQPGQQVRRGQLLMQLSTGDLDAQIGVVRADLERTRSSVSAGASSVAATAMSDLRAASEQWQAARQAEADLKAALYRDRAEAADLERELARERELVADGLVRNDRALALAARLGPLNEQLRTADERLAAAAARTRQAAQRLAPWQGATAVGADSPQVRTQVQPLRDAVQTKEAELKLLLERRARLAIVSPVDGVVTAVNFRPGDVVRVGDPALVVTGLRPTQVVAYVVERHRLYLQPGQRVLVEAASPGTARVEGRVRAVADAITQLPVRLWASPQLAQWGREVYIDVPPESELHPGEQLQVRFMEPAWRLDGQRAAAAASAPW